MPKSITSSSIPAFFNTSSAALTRPFGNRVLALAWLGTHGSWGFSPVGGNRLYSEGEPVRVLSTKGKEDCPELLTVLAVNLKENYPLDPCVVSSNPLWDVFPRAKFARGPTLPRTEASTAGEHQNVWCARCRRGTLPFRGDGSLGLNAPEDQLWRERVGSESKRKSAKKKFFR